MATETTSETEGREIQTEAASIDWKIGAVGGIVGAIVMGALMLYMNEAVIAVAIPSLYTLAPPPTVPVGMGVHLFHGAVLGVIFAAIVSTAGVESPTTITGIGIGWGVVTWVVLAALLMPLWLSAVGSPADPPFPNFAIPSLLWHVVYGLVLGGVYAGLKSRD